MTANGVIKQNGGISIGPSNALKFDTGVQFSINDPAAMQVRVLRHSRKQQSILFFLCQRCWGARRF